jgi:hypothetical protein
MISTGDDRATATPGHRVASDTDCDGHREKACCRNFNLPGFKALSHARDVERPLGNDLSIFGLPKRPERQFSSRSKPFENVAADLSLSVIGIRSDTIAGKRVKRTINLVPSIPMGRM